MSPNESSTGSEVATRGGSTALAIPDEVIDRFPALADDVRGELADLMAENFGDDEAMSVKNLTMVKVPSGSGAAQFNWMDNGTEETSKEIRGIVIAWQDRRNYWVSADITNERPDCTSRDGKIGEGMFGPGSPKNPTGMCEGCPMNIWHDVNGKRVPPPCKPQQAILLMVPGEPFPWYIQVPRTSLKKFKEYRASLLKKLKSIAQVETVITLKKVPAANGVPAYFELDFVMGEDLGKPAKRAALEVGASMKDILVKAPPITSAADRENVVPGEGGYGIGGEDAGGGQPEGYATVVDADSDVEDEIADEVPEATLA